VGHLGSPHQERHGDPHDQRKILEITPDGKIKNKYEVPSLASPNMTFSDDGKTMYVMAVDNMGGAPYEGKVYAVTLK
jgi:gluconolactonase